jgi:uncharacterized membrane protein
MDTDETPKEKKYSNWFLAEYYIRKALAWFLIYSGFWQAKGWANTAFRVSGALLVLGGIYLLINTKKE